MSKTDNLIRATDYAVFVKGMRGDWVAYPESGRIFSNVLQDFLTPHDVNGYKIISIRLSHGGRQYKSSVPLHRAMWILCHGIPPYLYADVDHIDGDRKNNRLENLRLISHAENTAKYLTFSQAEEIRCRRKAGDTFRMLAEDFKVSESTVKHIVYGRTHTRPPEKIVCGRL